MLNVNNTGTKKGSIIEINGVLKRKNGECAACLKYSVLIVVDKNIRNATSGG
jgi:hypothetical protein